MSNVKVKRKKTNPIVWVAIFLSIALLAVAVSAALTQGFTNADPYGWLEKAKQGIENLNNKDTEKECPIAVDDVITEITFDKKVTPDFSKLDWSKAEESSDGAGLVLLTANVKEDSESSVEEIAVFIAFRISVDDLTSDMLQVFQNIPEDVEYIYYLMSYNADMPIYCSETMTMDGSLELYGWTSGKIDLSELAEVKITEVNEPAFLATIIKDVTKA